MATITTMINDSRAGVAAEPLLRFLIRIALALLTTLAKKRSIGPQDQLQNQNSTSYTTRHEYQEGLWGAVCVRSAGNPEVSQQLVLEPNQAKRAAW
jgi:hypothetical protein